MTIDDEIKAERQRQRDLKAAGKFRYTCADQEPSRFEKLSILLEEIQESVDASGRGEHFYDLAGNLAVLCNEDKQLSPVLNRVVDYAKFLLVEHLNDKDARAELIQVAAVCDAWLEALAKEQGQ